MDKKWRYKLINIELAKKQKLTTQEIEGLKLLYEELSSIFLKAEQATEKELMILSMQLEELEYKLQEAWKFEKNPNKHSYWYKIPQCTCPKLDNADLWETGTRIFNPQCMVHKHLFTHISNKRH